jgi:hypothetical protein
MTLSTTELNAMLNVFTYYENWDKLSELIGYDVHKLRTKLMNEMVSQSCYDLECG